MNKFESPEGGKFGQKETPEQKKERFRQTLDKSLEVFKNPEKRLEEGALTVMRKLPDGKIETIPNLVVVEINEDGPNFSGIDEEGNPTASATMLWEEITDIQNAPK